MQTNNKLIFYTLFCVIIIDAMGMILPLPILGELVMSTQSPLLAPSVSLHLREILYGLVMSAFMLGMFIGSPILGDISDHVGRKRGILYCLLGTAIGNLISAAGIGCHSMTLVIVGRFFAGFASGSQPIAQAAIIDMSTAAERTINLSRIVLAITLGIILGPLFGCLGDSTHLVKDMGLSFPFLLAALIATLNALFLCKVYQEDFTKAADKKISLFSGFIAFVMAFNNKALALLSFAFFFLQIAWSLYFNGISLFMLNSFHYSPTQLGLFTAFLGLGSSIGMTIGIRWMMQYFKTDLRVCVICIVIMVITLVTITLLNSEIGHWSGIFILALVLAIAYTNVLSLYSNHAPSTHQGWIMGVAMSVATLAWIITSSLIGEISYINAHLPFYISASSATLSVVLLIIFGIKSVAHDIRK